MITDLHELEKIIQTKAPITRDKLDTILDFFNNITLQNNISCQQILIRNTGDSIRERDFLKLIFDHIVVFVLDYDEYQNKEALQGSELVAKFSEIINKAKSKFQTKNKNIGEIGELILFLLLESAGITKIVSKMRLKTSSEMPVFGADAIHIQVKNDELIFHFGEAKLYENFNQALDSALESIENLHGKQEDLEFDIINKHIDRGKFEKFTDQILEYLNPYFKHKENMKISYSIFIGYDWNILQDLTKRENNDLTIYLKNECQKDIPIRCKKITDKILSSKIKDRTFNFYLIPFQSVSDFRKSFLELL